MDIFCSALPYRHTSVNEFIEEPNSRLQCKFNWNIFTNELNGHAINDNCDHLPVFCVCSNSDMIRITNQKYRYAKTTLI